MIGIRRKVPAKQHGMASVELAIALPILALVMIATAEFARTFYLQNMLNKTVREGARYLASNAYIGKTLILSDTAIDETRYLVKCSTLSDCTGDDINIADDFHLSGIYAGLADGTTATADSATPSAATAQANVTCDNGTFGIATAHRTKFAVVCAEYSVDLIFGSAFFPTTWDLSAVAVMRIVDGGPSS